MPARIMIRPPQNRLSAGAQVVNAMFGNKSRLVRRVPVPRQYWHIINWGNSTPLEVRPNVKLYNNPAAIAVAANKLRAFEQLHECGVRVPPFTTEKEGTTEGMWLARTTLVGSGGDGIVVLREGDPRVDAPLYTKYIKKREEYRLHVVNNEVIFIQQKRKRLEAEQTRDQALIRNHDNGWVFTVQGVTVGEEAMQEAVRAVTALSLDFGAVDLIIGREDGLPYILEVNTAPGLSSPSLMEAYEKAFHEMVGEPYDER